MVAAAERAELIRATDAWFVREGVPQLVAEPEDDPDVNLRYFLIAIASAAAATLVLPAGRGWWLAVSVAAGLGLVLLVDLIDNRMLRGRYRVGEPRHRNLVVALLPAVVIGLTNASGAGPIIASALVGLAVIVIGTFMETFRLWKVTRWATRQTVHQLRRVFELFGRALPLLMLFAVTLFINADVWQTAAVLGAARFWVVVGFFLVVGLVFLTLRLPGEVRSQLGDIPAAEVPIACADSPLASCAAELAGDVRPVELTRPQRVNMLLILMFAQLLQVVLVATMIAVFFFVFGLFAIQESVINAWVGSEVPGGRVNSLLSFSAFGQDIVVTRELIRVAAFLGMLSGFYFTIYVITDKTYREDFFDTVLARVRRIVVVRAVYLALVGGERVQAAPRRG